MSNPSLQRVMRHIRQLAGRRAPQSRGSPGYPRQRPETPESDQDLLTRYLNEQDEEAFAELVRRHGPMIRGVCQRLLDQEADRDDAFQATFLVLLHKARSIRKRHSVGSWLYGVAYRIALKARARPGVACFRGPSTSHWRGARVNIGPRKHGTQDATNVADTKSSSDPSREAAWRELCALLDEELHRLSDRYRSPLVLCYLAGQTQEEAAGHLGWSLRTLKRRLERGKELLRLRLSRRGLTLSSTLLIAGLSQQEAAAVVPVALILETITEASLVAAAKGASTTISANTLALTQATLKSLAISKLKSVVLVCVLFAGLAAVGAGLAVQQMVAPKPALAKLDETLQQKQFRTAAQPSPKEEKPTRTDRYGDPLPDGAVQRLGTVRFRVPFQNSVAFCANGKTFVSALNSAVLMFDGTTGKIIRKFPAEGSVHSVAISPDGKMIAGGDHSGIRIWSAASGLETRQFQARDAYPRTLLFRPDGKALAAANVNGPFQLWDLTKGKELWNRVNDGKASLDPLAFSPDGKTLVVLEHGSQSIIFLDPATGEQRRRFDGAGKGSDLVVSSNLQKLAIVGGDWAIHLWDLTTGREIRQLPRVHQMPQRFTFSPNGKILAWARDEKSGRGFSLIDVATGKEVRRIAKNLEFPNVLTFWPNDKTLAFCTWHERTVRFWDIERDREIHSPEGHRGDISSIAYSRDGKDLTSAGMDGTVRQWDPTTGKELHQFTAHQGGLWGMALAPDGKTIATASLNDKIIRLWDSGTGKEIRRLEGYQGGVNSLAFSPDGHILASGGSVFPKDLLRFWDVLTGKEIRFAVDPNPVLPDARAEAYGILSVDPVKFSPDGKFLAAACRTNIGIFEVATGRRFANFVVSKSIIDIKDIAFSPDGRSLLCGGQGSLDGKYSIHLWELASGKERLPIKAVSAKTYSVAFSPDGKFLAAGGTDDRIGVADTVWLLDARNGEIVRKFRGHQSWMTALAFSPDGKQLASGAQDTTILIWNVANLSSTDRSQSLKLSTGDLEELWADLASEDAEKAYHGIWKLVAAPQQTVPLLTKRLKPAVSIDSERVSGLIAELDNSSFTAREKAFKDLSRVADLAEPALQKKLAEKPSLETRRRIETLVGKLQGPVTSPEMLQSLRAVEVLEHISTPGAKKLLDDLASGAPEARLTQEAKAALKRTQARSK